MYHYPHWNRDRATVNWQTALLSNGSKWVLLMMKIAILISALYKYYYYNYYRIRGVKGVAQWLVATKQLVLQQSNCQCSLSLTNLFRLIRKTFCLVLHKKRKMRISGFSFRKIMKPNIVIANSNLVPTRILWCVAPVNQYLIVNLLYTFCLRANKNRKLTGTDWKECYLLV